MSQASDTGATEVESSSSDATALPPLTAAFLIKFDIKIGYTIVWKRSTPGVEVDGVVEYKCLPSGLHNVKEDLVYFIHDEYAGVSAFISSPASESERHAHLVAVGILVPLSYGRLGRSWLHAQNLQRLATRLVNDTTKTQPLEEYWKKHSITDKGESEPVKSPPASPTFTRPSISIGQSHSRKRALSTVTAILPFEQSLPQSHPALSILKYIDTFGPLIYPLQRAALLRKRILFVASPPIRLACEFVYDLSILTSIPSSVTEILAPATEHLHRLRPLFTIGVHDIPFLEADASFGHYQDEPQPPHEGVDDFNQLQGWVACTTDEVLGMKTKLYDIIVEMPAIYGRKPKQRQRQWPKIKDANGAEVKATQRDLRRFRILHRELRRLRQAGIQEEQLSRSGVDGVEDTTPLLDQADGPEDQDDDEASAYDDRLIEPMSWSELAYNGFIWWASAGERDASQAEEADRDRALLGDLSEILPMSSSAREDGGDAGMESSWYTGATPHTALIAYFHRITASIFRTLAELDDSADDEDEDGAEEKAVLRAGSEDVSRMGLDVWSEADARFVKDVGAMYIGREVEVHGASIECCGIRIC